MSDARAGKDKVTELLLRLRGLLLNRIEGTGAVAFVRPWHVLFGAYALFAVIFVLNVQKPWPHTAVSAASLAFAAAGWALLFLPMGQVILLLHGRQGFSGGRLADAGTRRKLLRLVAAWSAIAVLLLPLPAIISSSDVFRRTLPGIGGTGRISLVGLWDFAMWPRTMTAVYLNMHSETGMLVLSFGQASRVALRVLNDLSILFLVCAVAYWLSGKCRTAKRAAWAGYAVAVVALTTVLCTRAVGMVVFSVGYRLMPDPGDSLDISCAELDSAMNRQFMVVIALARLSMLAVMLVRFGVAYLLAGRHLRAGPEAPGSSPTPES